MNANMHRLKAKNPHKTFIYMQKKKKYITDCGYFMEKGKASAKLQYQEKISLWICKKYHFKLKKHDAKVKYDERESNDMS